MALGILAMALVPSIDLFVSSRSIVFSSGRILEATMLGQNVMEAVTQLEYSELPQPSGSAQEWVLYDSAGAGTASAPAGSRFDRIAGEFSKSDPFPMSKVLSVRLPDPSDPGRMILTMKVRFQRLPDDPQSEYEVVLRTLVVAPH